MISNVMNVTVDEDEVEFPLSSIWDKQPPQAVITSEDLITMSATWHRIRTTPGIEPHPGGFSSVSDGGLTKYITDADREFSSRIRDYYSKKLMWLALNGKLITKFKSDLGIFLNKESGKVALSTDLPMIFRLPEFYLYDQKIEKIVEGTKKPTLRYHMQHMQSILNPLAYVVRDKKSSRNHEYWFTDEKKVPHLITLQHQNPLQHMWDKEFVKNEPMTIAAFNTVINRTDIAFVQIANWKLV